NVFIMTQNKLEQAHHHHVEPSNSGSQLTDPVCGSQNKLEQAHHHHVEPSNSGSQLTDPVCGMNVTEDSEHQFERDGEAFYFCSTKCLETFKHDTEKFLASTETGGVVVEEAAAGTIRSEERRVG